MNNKIILSVLALCCAGGTALAQLEAPSGIHVGPYAANSGPNLITFGDNAPPNTVYIGEYLADNTMVLNAGRFDFQNGNVGIGTSTPGSLFTIRNAVDPILELNNGSGLIYMSKVPSAWSGLTSPFILQANSSGDMVMTPVLNNPFVGIVIKQGGNVGIGDVNPADRLTVVGQISATTLKLTSDRNAKSNFRSMDSRDVLKKLANLPLSTWHYTNAPGVRHLGPMAQDFKAAFPELGEDDKHIATVDADGVALAAIQALYEMVQERDSQIAALHRQVSALETQAASVKASVSDRLAALERAMSMNVLQEPLRPENARQAASR